MPDKYKQLGSFYKYYTGALKSPILTILIGGNHESSSYMHDLFYGGYVAPNIYYLGSAGVVNVGGVRIGGYSGIYNERHWKYGHYEKAPYDNDTVRSVYHTREADTRRLSLLRNREGRHDKADVVMSHDWPRRVAYGGDMEMLFRKKKFLRKEVLDGSLGSPGGEWLLKDLKPKWWFSAHLHVRFEALIRHDPVAPTPPEIIHCPVARPKLNFSNNANQLAARALNNGGNKEKNEGEKEEKVVTQKEEPVDGLEQVTRFLALDKCLPRRQFLEILEIKRPEEEWGKEVKFEYDPEWMAILKKTECWTSQSRSVNHLPNIPPPTTEEVSTMEARIKERNNGTLEIDVESFVQTEEGPVQTGGRTDRRLWKKGGNPSKGNPQTDWILNTLGCSHVVTIPWVGGGGERKTLTVKEAEASAMDEDEIELDEEGDDDDEDVDGQGDDNEIDLDEDEDEIDIDIDGEGEEKREAKKPRIGMNMPEPENS